MKQESNIAITGKKQTDVAMNESNIKSYFCKLIELQKKDEPFPVDLDLVWPIAYTLKANCIRELKEKFIEGIDFQLFIKNDERSDKFRQRDEYRLSISCMEYLIVRKVRPIFEVYRQMFALTVTQLQFPSASNSADNANLKTGSLSAQPKAMNKKTPLNEVKAYLLRVKELAEQGDEFPIDVDDVWELAYCAKRRVIDKLLGVNLCNTNFVDGTDYKFVPTGMKRGKYYLSMILFEKVMITPARHLQGIYKEVFERNVCKGIDVDSGLIVLSKSEYSSEHIFRRKSTVADAFQQLVTVQAKLDSAKDRDALQRVMLVLSDYNMLLNRIDPNNE